MPQKVTRTFTQHLKCWTDGCGSEFCAGANRVVLYRGDIVEQGDAAQVHEHPQHTYTRALLAAAPVPDPLIQRERRAQFERARQALAAAT